MRAIGLSLPSTQLGPDCWSSVTSSAVSSTCVNKHFVHTFSDRRVSKNVGRRFWDEFLHSSPPVPVSPGPEFVGAPEPAAPEPVVAVVPLPVWLLSSTGRLTVCDWLVPALGPPTLQFLAWNM